MKRLIPLILGLTLIFIGACAGSSYAAIAKVQDKSTLLEGSTATVTMSSAVTAGDFIGVCVRSSASAITSVTDNIGNTYLPTTPAFQTSIGMGFWYVPASKAGTPTITVVSNSATAFLGLSAGEFSGMGLSPFQDGNFAQSAYGQAATIQTNTVTTSGGNPELLIGCGFVDGTPQTPTSLVDYGAGGGTPNAYSSNPAQTTSLAGESFVTGWQSVAATGPFGLQWSITTANSAGAIAVFKPNSPAINSQSICPQNGPCFYAPDTMANYLAYYKCNAGVTCQGVIVDSAASCVYNTKLTTGGGGGNFRCDVVYDQNQGAWIED